MNAVDLISEETEEKWVHSSAATALGHPLANIKTGLMRMMKKVRGFFTKSTNYTRLIKMRRLADKENRRVTRCAVYNISRGNVRHNYQLHYGYFCIKTVKN